MISENDNKILISVIVVTYNCRDSIAMTLNSIAEQTYENYEVLIIDGGSSDGTVEVIQCYVDSIKNTYFLSEPDNGIYDAMNKGVRYSKGKYVFFLNSGDVLYSKNILSNVSRYLTDQYDILYGKIKLGNRIKIYPRKITKFWLTYLERMICHQSIFTKRELLVDFPFNLEYKICADRDWLIKMHLLGKKMYYIKDLIIVDYDTTGVSSTTQLYYDESLKLGEKNGGYFCKYFIIIKRFLWKLIRTIL